MTDTEALNVVQDWLATDPDGPAPHAAIAQVAGATTAQANKLNEIAHCLFTLGLIEVEGQGWAQTRADGSQTVYPSLAMAAAGLWADYTTPN